MNTGPGQFITLEGGEGVGKSTQAQLLRDWLREQGIMAIVTREPGGSPRAEVLRDLLLAGSVAPFGPEAEAIVFAIARKDHLEHTIRPALARGEWVISDRFLDSTRAYQGQAGVAADTLDRLDAVAVGDERPNLTLILDLPVSAAVKRTRNRTAADRFEADPPSTQEARREAFLHIAEQDPARCVVIDARHDPGAVAASIRAVVAQRLLARTPKAG